MPSTDLQKSRKTLTKTGSSQHKLAEPHPSCRHCSTIHVVAVASQFTYHTTWASFHCMPLEFAHTCSHEFKTAAVFIDFIVFLAPTPREEPSSRRLQSACAQADERPRSGGPARSKSAPPRVHYHTTGLPSTACPRRQRLHRPHRLPRPDVCVGPRTPCSTSA